MLTARSCTFLHPCLLAQKWARPSDRSSKTLKLKKKMHIRTNNQRELELPEGSTAKDVAEKLNMHGPHQSIAAKINGSMRDLKSPLSDGDEVILVDFEEPE